MHYIDMKISKQRLREIIKEELVKEANIEHYQGYSSKEAKKIIDDGLKLWAKDLRKVQYRVIKDWMSKAKSGVIDYFDLVRGLKTGDIRRAHTFEVDFLQNIVSPSSAF